MDFINTYKTKIWRGLVQILRLNGKVGGNKILERILFNIWKYYKMQKHEEWLGNKNYQHHIQSLSKIKERNINKTNASKSKSKPNCLLSPKYQSQRRHTL